MDTKCEIQVILSTKEPRSIGTSLSYIYLFFSSLLPHGRQHLAQFLFVFGLSLYFIKSTFPYENIRAFSFSSCKLVILSYVDLV